MRKLLRLAFAAVSLAGISIADNFTTTCNEYYLEDDHVLHATCTAKNNVANQRQLDLNDCLANLDGQLALVGKYVRALLY